jgi:hypothetical protein
MFDKSKRLPLLASCALALLCSVPAAAAAESWQGQTFLSDYSKLQPVASKDGKDFFYAAPNAVRNAPRFVKVMLDQPEVFISPDSPYKGAKPQDVAAISGLVRDAAAQSLQERGYAIVDKPGADTLYLRLAITDLQIAKKKRGLLAYTPVGFVANEAKKAMQDFMDKYELLDLAVQLETQDSATGEVLSAAVLRRGKGADIDQRIPFDVVVSTADLLGDRLACGLDNARVPAAQRIDCTDPVAREARPKVVLQ